MVRQLSWTHEFDCKLNGDGGGPWHTHEGGLQQFRRALLLHLNSLHYRHEGEVQHVFIPVNAFGQSFREVLDHFQLLPLGGSDGCLSGFCPAKEVEVTINKWKCCQFDFFGRFAIDLRLKRAGSSEKDFIDLCEEVRQSVQSRILF